MASIFTFLAILFIFFESYNAVEIKTRQGSLKGLVLESRNGTKYHAFMGIPFAKPPVGNLRFEAPQSPDSWTGVRDATKDGSKCIQQSIFFDDPNETDIGQEDCLYLNVYAPSKVQSRLPVMVWIHGGGFMVGAGLQYDPEYFLDYDLIFVSFNYRVGSFGFLSAGDEILPGNYGLKDQIAALKWVQEYITDFGGNPQQVTIAGVSAGGASVHLLMHSPLSTGLFHRAISQSGTALAPWVQIPPSAAREKFQSFGVLAGCPTESTPVLVDCLKKIRAEEILKIQKKFYVWNFSPLNIFPLVKEPASVKDAFLREDPWNQRVLQEVPWIVGFTSAEGAMFLSVANDENVANELNTQYKRLLPLAFYYLYWQKSTDIDGITEKLKQFYFGDKEIGLETVQELTNLVSDALFNYDTMEAAYQHPNKVYVYFFEHKGNPSFINIFGNGSFDVGVPHGDDAFCFFPMRFPMIPPFNLSSSGLQISKRLVKYWVNFAYTGNPTPDNFWLPSESKEELTYLNIQTERDYVKRGLLQERYSFWKNLGMHPLNFDTRKTFLADEL